MKAPEHLQQLIPWPASIKSGNEVASPTEHTVTWEGAKTSRLEHGIKTFLPSQKTHLVICCENASVQIPMLGDDETYRLETGEQGVHIRAKEEWGILRGLATLAQLCPGVQIEIEDSPRFPWRGLMIDVARHFISIETLKRTVTAMACYKLNVLHLHLSDDQAFRFPSNEFPLLNARQPSYTAAELKALVELAANLGIRVVPEIDMPGHVNSWLVAYPEWGSGRTSESVRFGGHKACLDVTDPQTLEAIEVLLSEVVEIFPDKYVHIGGDEVNPSWWQESTRINEYMAQQRFTTTKELHAEFNQRLQAWLQAKNKIMIGWDEVLGKNLPLPMTVQSWRGATARDRALALGADCVVSANYYLDFWYPADLYYRFDPGAMESDVLAQEDTLCLDPRLDHVKHGLELILPWRKPAEKSVTEPGQILGGEACLWSELVTDELVDARLWGCMPAIAERFWSPADVTDVESMQARLRASWSALAQVSHVNMHNAYEILCTRFGINTELLPLLNMLEPTKWYARLLGEEVLNARLAGIEMPDVRPYNADMPLNRLVDYLPPESTRVWAFVRAVRSYLNDRESVSLEEFASEWSRLDDTHFSIPEGLVEVTKQLANLGLLLQSVLSGVIPDDTTGILKEAGKPRGEILLANVPAFSNLIATLRE